MPRDKNASHEKIIPAAKKEFLEKGFEKASMRSIADSVGMTSAALYRHFSDKEAMFTALVQPLLDRLDEVYNTIRENNYDSLSRADLDGLWSTNKEVLYFLDLICEYREEFKLLLCCSAGTKHEHFLHDFVMLEQRETLAFLQAAREKGFPVKEILPQELHMLLSAYIGAIFEIVCHDFSRDEAIHYLNTLQQFFYPGWRAVLGL